MHVHNTHFSHICLFIYNMLSKYSGTQRTSNLEEHTHTHIYTHTHIGVYMYGIELIQSEYLILECLAYKFSHFFIFILF